MASIPKTTRDAKQNLTKPVGAFAKIAVNNLDQVAAKLNRVKSALEEMGFSSPKMDQATAAAIKSLEGPIDNGYQTKCPKWAISFALGERHTPIF